LPPFPVGDHGYGPQEVRYPGLVPEISTVVPLFGGGCTACFRQPGGIAALRESRYRREFPDNSREGRQPPGTVGGRIDSSGEIDCFGRLTGPDRARLRATLRPFQGQRPPTSRSSRHCVLPPPLRRSIYGPTVRQVRGRNVVGHPSFTQSRSCCDAARQTGLSPQVQNLYGPNSQFAGQSRLLPT
jgi:hypothetical protein